MRKFIFTPTLLLITVAALLCSCKKDDPTSPAPNPINPSDNRSINIVTQFIYDGMSTYYYWADEVKPKRPTKNDSDPKAYFNKLLNQTDDEHGWSFITDNVKNLLGNFSGEPKDFGFSVGFFPMNEAKTEFGAVIQYVFPNTPASKAGLKRLDIIGKINGEPITNNNFRFLFGTQTATFTLYKLQSNKLVPDKDVSLTPVVNQTDPVLYTNIYEIDGKKIAYLFYTGFIHKYNSSLYKAFNQFAQAGATDVVLDLRYNRGGDLRAASYLGSLLAPKNIVEKKSPFVLMDYNKFINKYFDANDISRVYKLGNQSDSEQNPLNVNLDLKKVYIIATDNSASASELTTFCLRPYTEVIHIGEKTSGKYTASWTLHPYDDFGGGVATIYEEDKLSASDKAKLKNWAMQPIVAVYSNYKGENFSIPGYLTPNYNLHEGGGYIQNWKPIGDVTDTFLAQAIYLITGNETYKPKVMRPASRVKMENSINRRFTNPKALENQSLIIDDLSLTPDDFQKITALQKAQTAQ